MATSTDDEKKPLLVKANPSWRRTPNTSATSSVNPNPNGTRHTSAPQLQRNDSIEPPPQRSREVSSRGTCTRCHIRTALITILVAVVLERVTFYGLTGNLVLFLNANPFFWKSYYAMNALFVFFGISYIMSLVGGWVADSCLGRFKAILLAYLIYLIGFVLLPPLALNSDRNGTSSETLPPICGLGNGSGLHEKDRNVDSPFEEGCAWLIFISLIVTAIGAGALKANICPFGSDQLVQADQNTQLSFFNWFYWCVNLGSFIGLGLMTYIEQQISFEYGYIACVATLAASAIIFIFGRLFYTCRRADGSVLSNVFRIVREAWRRRRHKKQLHHLRRKSISQGAHEAVDSAPLVEQKISFLDHAKIQHGGIFHNSLVDDVKKLGIVLAVFAVLIPYWIVYFQMQTTFLVQGLHMKLFFRNNLTIELFDLFNGTSNSSTPSHFITQEEKPTLVAAWFSLFDAIFVIILLPLFDRVIYPRMARAGYPFTFTKRIVLGMLFAVAAMIVAGIVEYHRLKAFWPYHDYPCRNRSVPQKIGYSYYEAADMSVLWQIPQYALIGMSEVFASVACLQFAVSVAPKSMKAIITGLFYLFSGIGSLLGVAIISGLHGAGVWFLPKDAGNINCRTCNISEPAKSPTKSCHLDYYFYLLAAFEFFGLLLFLLIARKFKVNYDDIVHNTRAREDASNSTRNRHVQRQPSGIFSS